MDWDAQREERQENKPRCKYWATTAEHSNTIKLVSLHASLVNLKKKRNLQELFGKDACGSHYSHNILCISSHLRSFSESVKQSGFEWRLHRGPYFMDCERREFFCFLLSLLQNPTIPLNQHIFAIAGEYLFSLNLSPGSCWSLDIRKYGTQRMEIGSHPLLPTM